MRSPKTCRTRCPLPTILLLSVLQWSDSCYKRQNEYQNMCQQISFTNAKTLDENCLSVDQHLHSHPAPWCSSTPHILWICRPIQVKRKHEHKTGQCAPIQLHSTQNDAAWSLAAAANSSCCIIRPVPQPSMPNYCPLILSRHEDKLWRGRSSAHTVSDKCLRK